MTPRELLRQMHVMRDGALGFVRDEFLSMPTSGED
jgi:hypothetical protein